MSAGRVELFGLPFDPLEMDQAVARCLAWCRAPREPHTVITANSAIICMTRRDMGLREACRSGDLVLADGMPLVWTSRLAGAPVPERITGVDLMERLLQAASEHRLSVYLLGARPEVLDALVARCARDWPGLTLAGRRDGYFHPGEHSQIATAIRASEAHMLFVGMPSPFKETWCEQHRRELHVPVIMGVGGTFDVLAGHVRRAPRPLQRLGLEWAWRLGMEPRRMWRRYLRTNTEYLWLAAVEVLERRRLLGRRA